MKDSGTGASNGPIEEGRIPWSRRRWFATCGATVVVLLLVGIGCGRRPTANPTAPSEAVNTTVIPGVAVTLPPAWNIQPGSEPTAATISNVRELSTLSDHALQAEAQIGILILQSANPRGLSIEDWFNDYFANGFSSDVLDKKIITVAGRRAVRIEIYEIGRRVHIYVPKGSDVVEVTYGLYAPSFVSAYEAIVGSMQF